MKKADTHSSFCKEVSTLSMRNAMARDKCPYCRAYDAGRDDAAEDILDQCDCDTTTCECAFSPFHLAGIAKGQRP